ncbi:MAG: CoA-binding protein [Bacteroidia bacterium]
MKTTLVMGASNKPGRYATLAINNLLQYGHTVYGLAQRPVDIAGVTVYTQTDEVNIPDLDTVTLYLSPQNQREYYDWLIKLAPKRVIFNPGTENPDLQALLTRHGIDSVEACTLVLLSIGLY